MKHLLAFLLLFSASAIAQPTLAPKANIPSAIMAQATPIVTPVMSEKDYYKMMYEQAKENAASANSRVEWTLECVVALVLFILGAQIFNIYRLNKKDVELIEGRLAEQIKQLEIELRKLVNDDLESYRQEWNRALPIISKLNNDIDRVTSQIGATPVLLQSFGIEPRVETDNFNNFLNALQPMITSDKIVEGYVWLLINVMNNSPGIYEGHYNAVLRLFDILVEADFNDRVFLKAPLYKVPVFSSERDAEGKNIIVPNAKPDRINR